jgi:hypothetical protein
MAADHAHPVHRARAVPERGGGMNGRGTEARRSGRHRQGVPATQVHPQRWDPAKRAAAQQLDLIEPAWAVWYGLGARRFYAIATWPAPEPLIVQARTPDELRDLMREAEREPCPPISPSSRGAP